MTRPQWLPRRAAIILTTLWAAGLALPAYAQPSPVPTPAPPQTVRHVRPLPPFMERMSLPELGIWANAGLEVEFGGSPRAALDDHRRLSAALESLAPQRPGVVDAYVLSIALDSDPVFGREAREAARVLAQRYDAEGRSIVLAGPDGAAADPLPRGTIDSLSVALARIAELVDPAEDALILYVTSHGAPVGLAYHYGDEGYGGISPARLAALLSALGLTNRLLIVNACFAGTFVPALASETSVVVAAAAPDRTSFGCAASNDWTYFGDAFVNRALRRPQPLAEAFESAREQVAKWERDEGATPSDPRIGIGAGAARWLGPLEARMPREASEPTGRPAVEAR